MAARALQGLGGRSGADPGVLALPGGHQRPATTLSATLALALFGAGSSGAASIGLLLGGLLTDIASWRWTLFINCPHRHRGAGPRPDVRHRDARSARGRFDVVGAVTATLGAVSLVWALIGTPDHGWTSRARSAAFVRRHHGPGRRSPSPTAAFAAHHDPADACSGPHPGRRPGDDGADRWCGCRRSSWFVHRARPRLGPLRPVAALLAHPAASSCMACWPCRTREPLNHRRPSPPHGGRTGVVQAAGILLVGRPLASCRSPDRAVRRAEHAPERDIARAGSSTAAGRRHRLLYVADRVLPGAPVARRPDPGPAARCPSCSLTALGEAVATRDDRGRDAADRGRPSTPYFAGAADDGLLAGAVTGRCRSELAPARRLRPTYPGERSPRWLASA